jgi:peptidoglycan/xylan/chitin deacetylase (PgdA/CDA1 family)
MAVTVDDLPNIGAPLEAVPLEQMTERILKALTDAKAPAIGFVNEQKLEVKGEYERRIAVLERWLEAGFPLGNHTYSHPDINTTAMLVYQEDVMKGEGVTGALMRVHDRKLTWFRHPFTHTGADRQTKDGLDAFLERRGYRITPYTIANADWVFNDVYLRAKAPDQKERIKREYLDHTDRVTAWFEQLSRETLGYELPQVLLIHASPLHADVLPELLARLRARGYRFVTLEEAMRDTAYERRDGYAGPDGISWLHRWAVTAGQPNRMREEPEPPAWIVKLYEEKH